MDLANVCLRFQCAGHVNSFLENCIAENMHSWTLLAGSSTSFAAWRRSRLPLPRWLRHMDASFLKSQSNSSNRTGSRMKGLQSAESGLDLEPAP